MSFLTINSQAVKYYMKSKKVLEEFGDHPSFSGIRSDCQNIVGALKQDLMKQFNESEVFYQF